MINEFNFGQTWKMWISSLSLSIYSTFKDSKMDVFLENSAKSSLQLFFQNPNGWVLFCTTPMVASG